MRWISERRRCFFSLKPREPVLYDPIAFLPAHYFKLGSSQFHTSWRQQLSDVVHRPTAMNIQPLRCCCFPPFSGGQLSISIARHPTRESFVLLLLSGIDPLLESHREFACYAWRQSWTWTRTGNEARDDVTCALRLAEECGRREAVYVFPVFVDGMSREVVNGPRYPR